MQQIFLYDLAKFLITLQLPEDLFIVFEGRRERISDYRFLTLNQFIPYCFNYLLPFHHSCAGGGLQYAKYFGQGNLAQSQIPVCPKAHQAACLSGTFALTANEAPLGGLKSQQRVPTRFTTLS